jgi:hypothetical protein
VIIDGPTFLGWKSWGMIDGSPTLGMTPRIVWRPFALCAWEVIVGELHPEFHAAKNARRRPSGMLRRNPHAQRSNAACERLCRSQGGV